MAMHKKWRQTYFSTPSSLNHEAYPFWSGKHFNRGRNRSDHVEFDVSHKSLKNGRLCEDGQWRQIVTVMDAVEKGCTLFDIDQLRLEYSPDAFSHLLMCEFVDDAASVFDFKSLSRCFVDSTVKWRDFEPHKKRPFGDNDVWVGYDPSRTRDDASLVVIAPPVGLHGGYRVLEVLSYNNYDFRAQAHQIKKICGRYNVTKVVIDSSGIGAGVYELVKEFYPKAQEIKYTMEIKNRLVLKAKEVVDGANITWDAGLRSIPAAFMTIKKTITAGGGHTTFKATRTNETGHADIAWAIMHAFFGEAFASVDGERPKTSSVEIF